MPKLLIFDAFTLLIREKNVAIYALLRCKMSQFTHFCGVKFLASKSGTWEFWTNFMSVNMMVIVIIMMLRMIAEDYNKD